MIRTIEEHIFQNRKDRKSDPTFFYSLGGIEEIGKNCYCLEHLDEIIIIDFGIKFGNKYTQPGINGEIVNIDYLLENKDKISSIFITHGHEDHIGGIVYLLEKIELQTIYSPVLASELIKKKIEDSKNIETSPKFITFNEESIIFTKFFAFEFFRVNHSIPDSFGFSISSPNGVLVFSGDFRFDLKNKIESKSFQKLINIGSRAVDLLLCESTSAAQPGFNESENTIVQELKNIISSSKGRVIITFFASNLGRIEEIVKISHSLNRKIAIFGRSIESSLKCSKKVGLLNSVESEEIFIPPSELPNFKDKELLIICTGSQGEENSVLNLVSKNLHSILKLKPSDDIIFSSNVIPGNRQLVDELINRLYKCGCNIYTHSNELRIHASGHATKLEQQLFISLISPKFLAPVHGEKKMLHDLKRNALELNIIPKENIFILQNGSKLSILNGHVSKLAPSENITTLPPNYIMGDKLTDSGREILKSRSELASRGLLFISILMDLKTKTIFSISPITTIGCFSFTSSSDVFRELNKLIYLKMEYLLRHLSHEMNVCNLQSSISELIQDFLQSRKKGKIPEVYVLVKDTTPNIFWKDSISAQVEERA